ncbi:Hypothetical protein NTJ_06347 [Nesidiocoris tenuis]|uniref:Uncharacterized protein n=1 Tax=Nesidiocoris tenuis TaxID=355587 RepID=A0ABN7AMS5_9HEMI|nr:Hypothetical protein NTJ_06347 [Nesidiocoris tenuis]
MAVLCRLRERKRSGAEKRTSRDCTACTSRRRKAFIRHNRSTPKLQVTGSLRIAALLGLGRTKSWLGEVLKGRLEGAVMDGIQLSITACNLLFRKEPSECDSL